MWRHPVALSTFPPSTLFLGSITHSVPSPEIYLPWLNVVCHWESWLSGESCSPVQFNSLHCLAPSVLIMWVTLQPGIDPGCALQLTGKLLWPRCWWMRSCFPSVFKVLSWKTKTRNVRFPSQRRSLHFLFELVAKAVVSYVLLSLRILHLHCNLELPNHCYQLFVAHCAAGSHVLQPCVVMCFSHILLLFQRASQWAIARCLCEDKTTRSHCWKGLTSCRSRLLSAFSSALSSKHLFFF